MLSKEMVIIIAVCSAIGTLLLIVLVIGDRRWRSSAPLPTIQPLAHHREHHLEQLQNSANSSQLLVPSISEPNNSTVCLLPTAPSPNPPSRRHQSPSNTPRRTRSVISHSTVYSKNGHNRCGVPHGPHSQIQIVLPAPLALNADASNSTLSFVDKWVSAGTPQRRSS